MSKFNLFLKNNTKVTPENLKLLFDELLLMRNTSFIDRHEEQCKEVIQYVIEYLIYGDKHNSSIFDIFCEYNFMTEFIYLASLNHRSINLQIIKSFSVLILNLTNTTTLYYIFSNNFINQIISNDYEKYDDDFISYYVNFIKSLSLKIDTTTIQFFFHKQLNSFPLLQSAMKLYNHTDPMIKNVVRNVILTVLKIKYDPILDYFSTLPSITYFPFLANRLRDLALKLNEQILLDDQNILKSVHDDIIDDILYLQDIFSLKLDKINYILINSLFYYFILPLLCGSLVSMTKPKIAISTSIYILLGLFHYIKDECFLNVLFTVLFNEKLTKKLVFYMEEYPKTAKNYFFDWLSQKKSTHYTTFTNYISTNFSEPFIKSLLHQTGSAYPEILSVIKKQEKLADDVNTNSASFLKSLIEDVLGKFSNSEFDIMTTYHKNISLATGVNVGLIINDYQKDSFLRIMERLYKKESLDYVMSSEFNSQDDKNVDSRGVIYNNSNNNTEKTKQKTKTNYYKNECRENLYSYLRSKDDTLILLVSLLIFTIHRKDISKELLSKAKLLKASYLAKSEYDTNRILNEIFSVEFFNSNNSNLGTNIEINSRNSRNENGLTLDFKNINEYTANSINTSSPFDLPELNEIHEEINNETEVINEINGKEINQLPKVPVVPVKPTILPITKESIFGYDEIKIQLFYSNFFQILFCKENSDLIQKIYDSELVDNLLNLLMVEPSFRTITNRIILENILSLLIKDEGLSFVERSQLDIINKIYYSYLSNIKLIILNNKYIRETGFELFENEWKNYKTQIMIIVEDLVSRPYLLIPFNLEDVIEDYPKILRIQKTEVDNFKSNLMIFMTLHDLRNKIYKENESIKSNFPLKLGGFDLDLDQSYDITNIGIESYPCKFKNSSFKNFINYFLLIYQNYLYFAQPDLKDPQFALIKYKYALRHLEAQFDRSDPRLLNLIVKDKNNYIDISLYFEDVNKTSSVKKSLEEQRKSSRNTEYLLLDSYFDDMISKWKF